jgi:hypothetical protein
MLDGALVNGSRGTVVGFHTIAEAHEVEAELSFTPTKVKRDDGSPRSRPDPADARRLRETEAIQQLAKNIERREIVVPSGPGEKYRRRNGMIPMGKGQFKIDQKYPLVKFDDNNLLMLCIPMVFHEEGVTGKWEVERLQVYSAAFSASAVLTHEQIPITMAWALTIHKSQGQTMSHASTHLASAFAPGHGGELAGSIRSIIITIFLSIRCLVSSAEYGWSPSIRMGSRQVRGNASDSERRLAHVKASDSKSAKSSRIGTANGTKQRLQASLLIGRPWLFRIFQALSGVCHHTFLTARVPHRFRNE